MKQLTLKELRHLITITKGLPEELKIFIGDDEELNGIHPAHFLNLIDKKEYEEIADTDLCKDDYSILIS